MGNKAFDVTALGELLIDFTENGSSAQGNPMLEANPGGAPCNVLAMLEKLGKKTAFIGKVGNDMFGTQLKNAVEEVGIDTRNLVIDNEVHTTLAFVHTYPDGDRDFSFYRNPGADMMLTKDEIQEDLIRESSTSELFLPLTKEYAKQPAMPSMLQKKPDVSSALTRIFVRHYGNLWMTQRQRSNTALANAIF
jgi:sugar/nucleoside kinase (ribokinase family)